MIQFDVYEFNEIQYTPFWRNFLDDVERKHMSQSIKDWRSSVRDELITYNAKIVVSRTGFSVIQFDDDQMAEIFLLKYS
jgi:hypothetical protein